MQVYVWGGGRGGGEGAVGGMNEGRWICQESLQFLHRCILWVSMSGVLDKILPHKKI